MKTTKKGFTLIELIVVIAIIGVLAAILVPSMLGYVKKSKVSNANSAANSLQKAINTCLVEIDEESQTASDIGKIEHNSGDATVTVTAASTAPAGATMPAGDKTFQKISNYMDKATKLGFKAQIEGGVCQAVAVNLDATYTGTAPGGVVTVDNYKSYSGSTKLDTALAAAVAKAS